MERDWKKLFFSDGFSHFHFCSSPSPLPLEPFFWSPPPTFTSCACGCMHTCTHVCEFCMSYLLVWIGAYLEKPWQLACDYTTEENDTPPPKPSSRCGTPPYELPAKKSPRHPQDSIAYHCCSPEFKDETLLLKTLHALVTGAEIFHHPKRPWLQPGA